MSFRTTGNSGPVRAGIYCRMSLAIMGDTTKVDDQERLCRATAERLGWEVGTDYGHPVLNGVYQDNNRSAWQYNRKRLAWDQMIDDIKAGKITAIVVYHGDRLTRQPMDLEILIGLSRTRGIKLASPTGVKDLNNDDDQFTLGIEANVYRKESSATSRRRKQQYERWRLEGRVRPGGRGGRAYGFATDGVTLIDEECDIIREAARRVLAGESVSAIVRDINARGARTPTGREFSHNTMRLMLGRCRLAGLMPDGESKAAWPAVLDRETWERLQLVLAMRGKKGNPKPRNAGRWLLSGIAVCGAEGCGEPLGITGTRGRTSYACGACYHVRRGAEVLDAYVSAAVVARLGHEENPAGELPELDRTQEWQALTTERAATEHLLKDYQKSAGQAPLLMTRLDGIDARMAQLREEADTTARDRLVSQYRGITLAEFRALPLDVKRALTAATVRVTVLPASKRGPGFRTQDVRVERA